MINRNLRPLYIFDLDGTLAHCEHRRHLLDPARGPDRHREFYAQCHLDTPIQPVIDTLHRLSDYGGGADVWLFSGRSDEVQQKTLIWLQTNVYAWYTCVLSYNEYSLRMRPSGDHRPDDELKEMWLNHMLPSDRDRLVATFDDRQRVVDMWRRNGIQCFQVAPGDF